MKKLITISALAALLSAGIVTNASAFPHRGLAFAYGGAATFHPGAVVAAPYAAHVGPAPVYDVWGHWGSYYGPMVPAP